jgi:type III secretion system FlhB-like substrate exporter
MTVKDVEILHHEKASSGAERIVEAARQGGVSLVEDDGLLEVLARVPQGTQLPEDLLGGVAEILTFLHGQDTAGADVDSDP